MTAKEKAKELYFKYYLQVADGSFPEYNAKQCALIAVDEILKECCKSSEKKDAKYQDERINYWQQVKHELNNL